MQDLIKDVMEVPERSKNYECKTEIRQRYRLFPTAQSD